MFDEVETKKILNESLKYDFHFHTDCFFFYFQATRKLKNMFESERNTMNVFLKKKISVISVFVSFYFVFT